MYRLLPIVAWFLASPALAQVTLYPAKSGDAQARTVTVYSSLDEPLAQPMIEAFQAATAQGRGVITVDGRMIENLHVDDARRTLAVAEAIAALT